MYEAVCIFNEEGTDIKEVLKTCIFSYYEKRFVYKEIKKEV